MASPEGSLAWEEILALAAVLSGVARVRRRFLSYRGTPHASGAAAGQLGEGHLSERTTALARAGLYNFLAASFGEPPDEEYVEALWKSGAIPLLITMGIGGDGIRSWRQATTADRLAVELSSAYSQAFLRPGPQREQLLAPMTLPPADGADDAQAALSHGPAAEAVEAAYREAGLVVGGNGPIAPQHLSVELQFMHHCAAREAASLGEGDLGQAGEWRARQLRFLSGHLRQQAGALADGLIQVSAHPYYVALADLTICFLTSDGLELAQPGRMPSR